MVRFPFKNQTQNAENSTKMGGFTLFETLLALSLGALIMMYAAQGSIKFSQNLKVQAAAGLLNKLNSAADAYADDHYDEILASAPSTININVLEPYLGSSVPKDPFKSQFVMSTRKYSYTAPDPLTAGVITQEAVQILVQARRAAVADRNEIDTLATVRTDLVNAAGPSAGFFSTSAGLCSNSSGTLMPAGTLCGAYGSFSVPAGAFSQMDANSLYGTVVTKGDSSVYGDQLYRYDFGDPELNTMRTDLYMSDMNIRDVTNVMGVQNMVMEGTRGRIYNNSGEISILPSGNLLLGSGTNTIALTGDGTNTVDPVLVSGTGGIQIGTGTQDLIVGGKVTDNIPQISSSINRGSGDVLTGNVYSDQIRSNVVNSLHKVADDPLRLQDFQKGEVIIGSRARYLPSIGLGPSTTQYELSDGLLTTGVVNAQDFTCADCGGSLSEILPKWRHMGTYFIPDASSGTLVPMPNCGVSRREEINRGTRGDEAAVSNGTFDNRYRPRILLLPKHIAKEDGIGNEGFDIELRATKGSTTWRVMTNKPSDGVHIEAFAMTYCVFVGGVDAQRDLTAAGNVRIPVRENYSSNSWTKID
jgi:type II secretory pathway pseudopilin PulG